MEDERDALTSEVIAAAIEVHKALGPGLLESAYEACLCYELRQRNCEFVRQWALPVTYKGVELDCGYRIDVMIPGKLIIEIKAVESLTPLHAAQLLTYMNLSGIPKGLLLNFNVKLLRDGIKRMVL
ncbi:MAG: hypothetical protein BIFFINMI_03035 [Phycisphaerae bacterium]|nr:hypothetical protein [Phycisphaerae bacterium]